MTAPEKSRKRVGLFCVLVVFFVAGFSSIFYFYPFLGYYSAKNNGKSRFTNLDECRLDYKVDILNTTYPFIGNDLFYDFADVVYSPSYPLRIKNGTIVFLNPENITSFAYDVDSIQTYFVLLTRSNGDVVVPYITSKEKKATRTHYEKVLNNQYLIAWFASNPVMHHPKIVPLPLGNKWQWITPSWHAEDLRKSRMVSTLKRYAADIEKNFRKEKPNLLHVSLSEGTSDRALFEPWRKLRREAVKNFKANFQKIPVVVVNFPINETCAHANKHSEQLFEWEKFMATLTTYKFVLSPPGRGPDVHRTWEALLMGSIPVVQSGPLDFLYFDLPVLTVDTWDELTPDLLKSMHPVLLSRSYNFDKLFAPYWIQLINDRRKAYWNQ